MLCVLTYGFQGPQIKLTNIKPDTAQKCSRSIYIPADRNHCDKNLTKDTCIKFTPG